MAMHPYIKRMRLPLMILSALGAGLLAGRKLLGKEITGHLPLNISRKARASSSPSTIVMTLEDPAFHLS